MSDASTLRGLLKRTDMSAPAIQAAAGSMMRHYDRSAAVAVTEWRNALQQARNDQHLPLLYVANEVLQNSKRNRGNKFLEAFSPILGQALIHVSQDNPPVVEKVRRTVKIWGDRHVFSIRFVNELLKGLEPYRNGGGGGGAAARKPPPQVKESVSSSIKASSSSPAAPKQSGNESSNANTDMDVDNAAVDDVSNDSDGGGVFDDDDDDDDANLFGDASDKILNIDLDLDQATATTSAASKSKNRKRPRPSGASNGGSGTKPSRRRSILSTNNLMELWTQVSTLQQSYDHVQTMLSDITPEYLDDEAVSAEIDSGTLVGDELLQAYKQSLQYTKRVVDQRLELHSIAQKRKALEIDAVRYLPWLENALQQDEDDVEFCDKLEKQLERFSFIHGKAKEARQVRVAAEAKRQEEQEELEKKRKEEEERKKFMESAMSKVTEAAPGMVWNKATGEYQYLQTDESWRD